MWDLDERVKVRREPENGEPGRRGGDEGATGDDEGSARSRLISPDEVKSLD